MNPIILPYPPSELSPNKRLHWTKKAPITANYRHACFYFTKQVLDADNVKELQEEVSKGNKIALCAVFYKPDKRHRDDSNAFASFKAGEDGIAQAIGIDDKHFKFMPFMHDDIVKDGQVIVTLSILTIHGYKRL